MSMSHEQVAAQLRHMVSFILREANEKSNEILTKAEEQFARERAQRVRSEKEAIRVEYDRRIKQIEVSQKIARSNTLNQSRLRVLKAQEDIMAQVLSDARDRLASLSDPADPKYKELLGSLVLQGLLKLSETKVQVRCRECDKDLVQQVLSQASDTFSERTGRKCTVSLSKTFLAPPASAGEAQSCSGGVILLGHHGRIVLDNTLDQRLDLAFEGLLPTLRTKLFGMSENRKYFA